MRPTPCPRHAYLAPRSPARAKRMPGPPKPGPVKRSSPGPVQRSTLGLVQRSTPGLVQRSRPGQASQCPCIACIWRFPVYGHSRHTGLRPYAGLREPGHRPRPAPLAMRPTPCPRHAYLAPRSPARAKRMPGPPTPGSVQRSTLGLVQRSRSRQASQCPCIACIWRFPVYGHSRHTACGRCRADMVARVNGASCLLYFVSADWCFFDSVLLLQW